MLFEKHHMRRRWDIGTQERNICEMEIKIVTLIVKGIVKLPVPPNRHEDIQVRSRSVTLRRVLAQVQFHISDGENSKTLVLMAYTLSMYLYMTLN